MWYTLPARIHSIEPVNRINQTILAFWCGQNVWTMPIHCPSHNKNSNIKHFPSNQRNPILSQSPVEERLSAITTRNLGMVWISLLMHCIACILNCNASITGASQKPCKLFSSLDWSKVAKSWLCPNKLYLCNPTWVACRTEDMPHRVWSFLLGRGKIKRDFFSIVIKLGVILIVLQPSRRLLFSHFKSSHCMETTSNSEC